MRLGALSLPHLTGHGLDQLVPRLLELLDALVLEHDEHVVEALAASGRRRDDQRVYVGFQGDWLGDASVADTPWVKARQDQLETEVRRIWAGSDAAMA